MSDDAALLQRVKAQAEVLSPLIRRLEAEIGADRTRSICARCSLSTIGQWPEPLSRGPRGTEWQPF